MFSGQTHTPPFKGALKAIVSHVVIQSAWAKLDPTSNIGVVGGSCHILEATSHNDLVITASNRLIRSHNSLQARSTHLVDSLGTA